MCIIQEFLFAVNVVLIYTVMLYQTHIVYNFARAISGAVITKQFKDNSLPFPIVDFIKKSVENNSLFSGQHPLDRLYVKSNETHLIFTWSNKDAAQELINLAHRLLTFGFVSATLVTLDEDQV